VCAVCLRSGAQLPLVYTPSQLSSYLSDYDYGIDPAKPQLVLAIQFDNIPGSGALGAPGRWDYSIRMNFTDGSAPPTSESKVRRLQRSLDMRNAHTYLENGFAATQLMLDRYIIGKKAADLKTEDILKHNGYDWAQEPAKYPEGAVEGEKLAEPLRYAPQRVEASPLPIAGYESDIFYTLVENVFPVYFILTFLYTQKKVINELIEEKESKVREALRMLGMHDSSLIGAWYITYALIFGVLCAIFTAVASIRVFELTSVTVLWAFFWMWCMSFVAFAFGPDPPVAVKRP
jgi:ATP-binding cassette subfamily A (ABC1) protein 1